MTTAPRFRSSRASGRSRTIPCPSTRAATESPSATNNDNDLTGLFKIKFRDLGLRVVYKTEMVDSRMKIIVVSARSDDQVYREAARRRSKHDL